MARVFLSHAASDAALAARVHQLLVEAGHEVYLDLDPSQGLRPGDEWEIRLYERLKWADALVCIVTMAFVSSTWCAAEIGVARSMGKRVMPIQAEPAASHPLLSSIQSVELSDLNSGGSRLLAALRRLDSGGRAWPGGRSPYPGLRSFATDDHAVFFGRAAESNELAQMLRSAAIGDRSTLVVGPSGCGKSSLVRAGLVPVLAGEPDWLVLPPILPGADPVAALARALATGARNVGLDWTVAGLIDRLADGTLAEFADDLLAAARPARVLLLVIDQMEELITRAAQAARERFISLLRSAGPPIRVVGTLGADFLGPLSTVLPARIYSLQPLRRDALRVVIEKPAELAGIAIEDGLVERMVDETSSGEAMPLLAYTLAQLVEGVERGGLVTASRYEQLGGVRGALSRQADAALEEAVQLSGRTPDQVLANLLRLVTLDELGRPVRRVIRRAELAESSASELDAFVARRLLSTDGEAGVVVVRFTHEALFSSWPPLANAIQSRASSLRAVHKLEQAAVEWMASGRQRDWLWQGARLAEAITALGLRVAGRRILDADLLLTPDVRQFLQASLDRRRSWRRVGFGSDTMSGVPPDTSSGDDAEMDGGPEAGVDDVGEQLPVPDEEPPPVGVDPLSEVVSDLESAEDRLGITDEVRAIARMLAALNTAPPLSVALLGNWGSGKSSFMRQVIGWVDVLAEASKANPRASRYAANVRQVRFNAWHYSDDHLWVGLVEHMFRELADHKRDPHSDAERQDLQDKLEAEEARLRRLNRGIERVEAVPSSTGWFGWVLQPFRLASLLRAVGVDLRQEMRSPKRLFIGLALIVLGAGLVWLFTYLGLPRVGWVAGLIAGTTALVGPLHSAWRGVDAMAEQARSKLRQRQLESKAAIQGLADQLDLIDPARRLRNLLTEISTGDRYEPYRGLTGRIQHDLDRLSSDLTEAHELWESGQSDVPPPVQRIILYVDDLDRCTASRQVKVLQAINLLLSMPLFIVVVAVDPRLLLPALDEHHSGVSGGRRRARAVKQRARSLDYLDKIFHITYAVRPMTTHGSDYLRSLLPPPDSGEPEREPEPANAQIGQTISGRSPNPAPDAPEVEPGAVNPRDSHQSSAGAEDLRRPTDDKPSSLRSTARQEPDPAPDTPSPEAGDGGRETAWREDDLATGDIRVTETRNVGTEERDQPALPSTDEVAVETHTAIDLTGRELRLWSAEREFLPLLAPLLPTPRAVKKLTNLYRLVRIGVPPTKLAKFIGGRDGGPYQAVALLLAAILGPPGENRSFLSALRAVETGPGQDIVDVLVELPSSALAPRLAEHIITIRKSMPVHGDVATYRSSACHVSRFSFETYQLFRFADEDFGSSIDASP